MHCSGGFVRQSFPHASGGETVPSRPSGGSGDATVSRLMRSRGLWMGLLVLASGIALGAESSAEKSGADMDLSSVGASLVRVMGALGLVLALFFAGVWVVRNWARIAPRRAGGADLQVLEVRSLGVRQNLVVVGYRRQRMLLSASPTGVTLLAHLPEAETDPAPERLGESANLASLGKPDFLGAFREVLSRRS